MTESLQAVMDRHGIGDAELGAECVPPIHRSLIGSYRKREKVPGSDKARSIIVALKRRGVEITLDNILAVPRKKRGRKRAA